ncbi:chromatin-binding protein [Saccharomycopsis crataegensis]|uniref:Chromatin-binding protein n=1 Tax=Saccharomycopsis crataegensis TaxID=43959 RepID=A0AAV5QWE7_9ASCO|nr:chromatin-binding protein [Saccharomycopsis crataegensis]
MSNNIMNIFSDSKLSLTRSSKNHLFVGNNFGIIKVVDLHHKENEPEVLEIADELTNFEIRHNLIALTTAEGDFLVYRINESLSNVEASLKCYRSELPLRDVVFLDNQHVVVGGDDSQLILINLSKLIASNDSKLYHWSIDSFDDKENIIKIDIPDQIRSITYNEKESVLAATLSCGDIQIFKYNKHDSETPLTTVSAVSDYYGKYVYIPGDEEVGNLDNLAKGNASWNPSKPKSITVINKANDINLHDNYADVGKSVDPSLSLSGYHKSEVIEIQYCPFNYQYLASIDYENRLIVWNLGTKKPIFNKELKSATDENCHLKNISWSCLDNTNVIVSVGTTTGNIFMFDSLVEIEASTTAKKFDFQEEDDDDDIDFSDDNESLHSQNNNNISSTRITNLKRTRADFESDSEVDLSDEENNLEDTLAILRKSANVLPSYSLKPYCVGVSPWVNNKRYLTINEIGYVYAERNVEDNTQTINVKFHDFGTSKNIDYYLVDGVGYDLAYLNDEGVLFAKSAFIDEAEDLFGTSFTNLSSFKQAKIYYRPHKGESDSWDKLLPIKNYFADKRNDNDKSKLYPNEFITNINMAKRFIFVFTNQGHTRILTKFGLLIKIEKSLPVIASISNSRILFTITSSLNGREFQYSIRDLITTNQQNYIEKNQLLPIDYLSNKLLDDTKNFDKLLVRFQDYEKKNTLSGEEFDIGLNKGHKQMFDDLVYKSSCYLLKGLFFNNYGDPCFVDNSNYLFILSKWKKSSQGVVIPLLNLNEILLTKSHLNYVPISLVDEQFNVCIFTANKEISHKEISDHIYPIPLPEPTEISIRIPISLNVDMKVVKEQQRARREEEQQQQDEENFIDDGDDDDENDDLLSDSDDEELEESLRQELASEEGFLRAKLMGDLINESIDSHNLFQRTITNKFKIHKKTKRMLAEAEDDDYYLNDLDLNLSDNEIENDGDELKLKNDQFDINDSIDKLQELNSVYDKSLLKIFSEFCSNQELVKAGNLIKELKQDRALIAASRIAERLELADLASRINSEREKRMGFD